VVERISSGIPLRRKGFIEMRERRKILREESQKIRSL
jgi:hypothetical protein